MQPENAVVSLCVIGCEFCACFLFEIELSCLFCSLPGDGFGALRSTCDHPRKSVETAGKDNWKRPARIESDESDVSSASDSGAVDAGRSEEVIEIPIDETGASTSGSDDVLDDRSSPDLVIDEERTIVLESVQRLTIVKRYV